MLSYAFFDFLEKHSIRYFADVMAQASPKYPKAFAQACSYCHSRKIKCVPSGKSSCRTCEDNSIECRRRRPKKLGRPRGAPQPAFTCRKQSARVYRSPPPRPPQATPLSKPCVFLKVIPCYCFDMMLVLGLLSTLLNEARTLRCFCSVTQRLNRMWSQAQRRCAPAATLQSHVSPTPAPLKRSLLSPECTCRRLSS